MSSQIQPRIVGLHPRRQPAVIYPEGDGKPMAETGPHVLLIALALVSLRYWFRSREEAYVGANMFLYYVEGRPDRCVAPDLFVVRGVSSQQRRSFKLWEEKQAPQVVIEFTSAKTHKEDVEKKRSIYAQIGVSEYFLFDPYGRDIDPLLQGYRLGDRGYEPLAAETLSPPAANGTPENELQGWRLWSECLQLELWGLPAEERKSPFVLRFFDRESGKWLADPEQALIDYEILKLQLREAEARAGHEVELRTAAEAQARREAQARKAEAKARKAEAKARKAAETEAEKLRAKLRKSRNVNNQDPTPPPKNP